MERDGMVTAAPAFLEEVREAWVRTEVRRELHERFDFWLDSVEEMVKEEPPSLEALTRAVWATRQELTAMVAEALVKRSHQQALEQKSMPCPQCGHLLQARASVARSVARKVETPGRGGDAGAALLLLCRL